MHVIAVINHKGGVAKTTTSVNLAAALAEAGRRILLVDLDAQASSSLWLGHRTNGLKFLQALVEGEGFAGLVQATQAGFDLVPTGPAFASFEKVVGNDAEAQTRLRNALAGLPEDRWDYILIDCPPSLNLSSINALVAATNAIVPVTAKALSLEPLVRLLDTMWQVRERLNPQLELTGMFASQLDQRNAHGAEVLKLLRQQFGEFVYTAFVRENVHLAEAAGFHKPVTQYAPTSNGAEDYRALAREFEERMRTPRSAPLPPVRLPRRG